MVDDIQTNVTLILNDNNISLQFFSPQREIFFESKTYFFEEYFQLKPIGIVLDNYTFLVDVFPSIGEFLLKINWFLLCKQCTNYGSILIY